MQDSHEKRNPGPTNQKMPRYTFTYSIQGRGADRLINSQVVDHEGQPRCPVFRRRYEGEKGCGDLAATPLLPVASPGLYER